MTTDLTEIDGELRYVRASSGSEMHSGVDLYVAPGRRISFNGRSQPLSQYITIRASSYCGVDSPEQHKKV